MAKGLGTRLRCVVLSRSQAGHLIPRDIAKQLKQMSSLVMRGDTSSIVNTGSKGNRVSELVYRETRLKKEVSFMFYRLTEGKVKL